MVKMIEVTKTIAYSTNVKRVLVMESLVNGGTEFYRLKYIKKKTLIDSIPEKSCHVLGEV
jgi:hypothetical protein